MRIVISKKIKKQLGRLPTHIYRKFFYWLDLIRDIGVKEARKYKGFHDESLVGNRKGQRSVRLSKAYRVIYQLRPANKYEIVEIIEVNKHEY